CGAIPASGPPTIAIRTPAASHLLSDNAPMQDRAQARAPVPRSGGRSPTRHRPLLPRRWSIPPVLPDRVSWLFRAGGCLDHLPLFRSNRRRVLLTLLHQRLLELDALGLMLFPFKPQRIALGGVARTADADEVTGVIDDLALFLL